MTLPMHTIGLMMQQVQANNVAMRQDNERRIMALIEEVSQAIPLDGSFNVCRAQLVHHDGDDGHTGYWYGSTTSLSLWQVTQSQEAMQFLPPLSRSHPLRKQWDARFAVHEIRTFLEHAIHVYDQWLHLEDELGADWSTQEAFALNHQHTFVRINSFMALEKSLKTLWSLEHPNERSPVAHQVNAIYGDLTDGVKADLLTNLQDILLFKFPEPNPSEAMVDAYLEQAGKTYMKWRYLESSDQTDMVWELPGLEFRLTTSVLVTIEKLQAKTTQ